MLNSVRRAGTARSVLALTGILVASIAVVLAAASANSARAANAPFKVLFISPNSGALSGIGKVENAGMRAAANIINRQGGILGSKVEITNKDDAGDGAKATATALQETSTTNYNLVSCGTTLAQGLACAPAIAKIPALQIPTIQDLSFNKLPRTFGIGTDYPPAWESVVRQMIKRKIKSVVVVNGDNTSGHQAADALVAAVKRHKKDIKVTKVIYVPIGLADATPQVQAAVATGAKAIVIGAFTGSNLPVLRAREKLGVTLPVFTDWLFSSGALNALTPEQRRGVTTQVWPWMIKGSKATKSKFFANFSAEFNKEIAGTVPLAITAAVTASNVLFVARAAARLAKSTEGPKMAKQMSKITKSSQVPGFIGTQRLYSKKSHNPKGDPKKDWVFVKAGTLGSDGFITPDK